MAFLCLPVNTNKMPQKIKQLHKHLVTSVSEIADNYFILSFTRKFKFKPGQVVAIALDKSHEPRLYSIASSNTANEMRILFDIKQEGFLTPKLAKLKAGDSIMVTEPFGEFIPSNSEEWWIATGTGIAPFISMIESGIKPPKKLIYGARYLDQFLFQDLMLNKIGNNYMRFCTQEKADNIFNERLSAWIEKQDTLPKQIKYYLCGNPEMVVDVRDLILAKGVPFENIMAEIYF